MNKFLKLIILFVFIILFYSCDDKESYPVQDPYPDNWVLFYTFYYQDMGIGHQTICTYRYGCGKYIAEDESDDMVCEECNNETCNNSSLPVCKNTIAENTTIISATNTINFMTWN